MKCYSLKNMTTKDKILEVLVNLDQCTILLETIHRDDFDQAIEFTEKINDIYASIFHSLNDLKDGEL